VIPNSLETALVVARYGAEVLLLDNDGGTARSVVDILERQNALMRLKYNGKPLTLACNIDQILIVVACQPAPQWELVDQLIGTALNHDIGLLILAHKADLPCFGELDNEIGYYRALGYPIAETSLHDVSSIDALRQRLGGKTNVVLGQSGMGKSSLTDHLVESSDIRIGALSARALGRDTTTVARCYPLGDATYLIDSPGIRNFVPARQNLQHISQGFEELSQLAETCRFSNCGHVNEPDCAVVQGLAAGQISERRYASYRLQLSEYQRQKNQGGGVTR